MENVLNTLFIQLHNSFENNTLLLDKINSISSKFLINKDKLPLYYIGVLFDFIEKEPQYYYNEKVANEIIENLNLLYNKDKEIFVTTFFQTIDNFFNSLNSYNSILDLHEEFDNIGLENITKTKIYYIPLITNIMEFCLNHFYKGIANLEGAIKGKDYTKQNTLGKLKNILVKNYPNLLNIDIDFRDALSHGMIDVKKDKIEYSYIEKGTREIRFNKLSYYELENKKNELLDIASGAILGFFLFTSQKEIITNEYLGSIDEKNTFEFFKLFLHTENIRVKSYSKGIIGSSQLNIHIDIKNINDKNQLIHLLVLVSKTMYIFFPVYEKYFVEYTHPYSISGMIMLERKQLEKMILSDDISEIDRIIGSGDSLLPIPDIQDISQDNRSYKFHTFPKIAGHYWQVKDLKDISTEKIKRFIAKLIINKEYISKEEIKKVIFQAIKKIKMLENKKNPIYKIKYGKMPADVVRLEVFYRTSIRNQFSLLSNNNSFICIVQYYRSMFVPKIDVGFPDNYIFEKIKKIDIFWNKKYYIL